MKRIWLSMLLISGIILLILGFSSSSLWNVPSFHHATNYFNVYADTDPPYDYVIIASLFDRAMSYRAYEQLLSIRSKVALVEFKQPTRLIDNLNAYVEDLKSIGNRHTVYIGQDISGEIASLFANSVVLSPTTFTLTSTVVVATGDFDGTKQIAFQMEKSGKYVVWTKATHTTLPYADGICVALGKKNCDEFPFLFIRILEAMVGMALLMWWLYSTIGIRLEARHRVVDVKITLLILFPIVGFVLPFVLKFFHLPILGVEEIIPLSGFAALVGLLAGGKYKFIDFGMGLILSLVAYLVLLFPMYYLGISPYITLNKVALIPVIALLVSPYMVALERWRYHFSKVPFSFLWLPFVYLLLWFPYLFSSFFYVKLPFYHVFFYSYKILWIHILLGFVTLPWFRKYPEYTAFTTAYLWAAYMVFSMVEVI